MPGPQVGLHVRHAAVLGHPIAHSRSPVLHRAAYRALGLDWTYTARDCTAAELPGVLADAGTECAGFSCTMPLKRAALHLASGATATARTVGAANTLLPDGAGGWHADNTDVDGLVAALADVLTVPDEVVMLGAGGTAQAAVVALHRLGVRRCTAVVRSAARAADLRSTAHRAQLEVTVVEDGSQRLGPGPDTTRALAAAHLVVSTLPAGAADRFGVQPWRADQSLLEVVYDPWPTVLAGAMARAGARVVAGDRVLLHQAAAQVTLMTGRPAPIQAMASAITLAS